MGRGDHATYNRLMERIRRDQAEDLGLALSYIPQRWHELTACDYFCGDPIFAYLCVPEWANATATDGRSYRTNEHVLFPYHARDKRLTVVLPRKHPGIYTVLHELGHVVHWKLYERTGRWDAIPSMEPVTDYARTNLFEAFAEAFTAWFWPIHQRAQDSFWTSLGRSNDEFFDRLLLA